MEKEENFIGCTKCYKRKKDCKCVFPALHIIHKRAWYYSKFGIKKGCGKEFDQDHGTPVYCGMKISGILHLCKDCQKVNGNTKAS